MAGNIYNLKLRLSDGSIIDAGNFEAPEGPQGAKGDAGILYGICGTVSYTAAKTVTISGFSLYTGVTIAVKFADSNTATSPTLNVSGTGAKSIRTNNGAPVQPNTWRPGEVVILVYDGTYWIAEHSGLASTEYYGMTMLDNNVNSTSTDKAATADAVRRAYELANNKIDMPGLEPADEGSVLMIQEETVIPAPKSDVICGCIDMTEEQKAQARSNIGAAADGIIATLTITEVLDDGRYYTGVSNYTSLDIYNAVQAGKSARSYIPTLDTTVELSWSSPDLAQFTCWDNTTFDSGLLIVEIFNDGDARAKFVPLPPIVYSANDGDIMIVESGKWTATPKSTLINDVIDALPKYNGEVVE